MKTNVDNQIIEYRPLIFIGKKLENHYKTRQNARRIIRKARPIYSRREWLHEVGKIVMHTTPKTKNDLITEHVGPAPEPVIIR